MKISVPDRKVWVYQNGNGQWMILKRVLSGGYAWVDINCGVGSRLFGQLVYEDKDIAISDAGRTSRVMCFSNAYKAIDALTKFMVLGILGSPFEVSNPEKITISN